MGHPTPHEILHQYWGYPHFRPLQEAIIQSVLDGKDTLALLPTGGGKSVCFQVPTLCRPGICLVISPLIALMKDQVYQLRKRNIQAEAIHSGMRYQEIDRILDNCIYGQVRFLYLSPERLLTDIAIARIRQMPVSLIAVDEAHCISQWGYDFRPPYLEIARIREWMPQVPVLALTATATPEVVLDIQEKLAFRQPNPMQKSFGRPNLAYVVRPTEDKESQLTAILKKVRGSGVVYVRNRRRTREIAALLQQQHIAADFYHAGLSAEERSRKQDDWIQDRVRIMVSTNAFGMGIDKPDVRLVVHFEPPDSLEAYFQEAGRAGRDEQKAYAVLLYHENDLSQLERQHELAFPEPSEIRRVYQALGSYLQLATGGGQGLSFDFDLPEFARTFQFDPVTALNCLKVLEQEGWVALSDAVYHPATLEILVHKEGLYDYQLKHPAYDKILKLILRTYQGVWNGPVPLQEKRLASFLNIGVPELEHALQQMQGDQILKYTPVREKPQLCFLKERIPAQLLHLDYQAYDTRKKRALLRLQKVMGYTRSTQCRSQYLLAYFGETNAPACGVCDVCLEQKKQPMQAADFQRYRQKIRQTLRHEALQPAELLSAFNTSQHPQVLEALELLLLEGQVFESNQRLHWRE